MAAATIPTLYQLADAEIRECIKSYLTATKATHGFTNVTPAALQDERARTILLAGLGVRTVEITATEAWNGSADKLYPST